MHTLCIARSHAPFVCLAQIDHLYASVAKHTCIIPLENQQLYINHCTPYTDAVQPTPQSYIALVVQGRLPLLMIFKYLK